MRFKIRNALIGIGVYLFVLLALLNVIHPALIIIFFNLCGYLYVNRKEIHS